jgi:hypothetical protein
VKLQPHDLTFIAKRLGRRDPAPLRWIELLASHASPVVREGAVYGRLAIEEIAGADPSPGVRSAAREALEP